MLIDIYESAQYTNHYVAVPAHSDITKMTLNNAAYTTLKPFPRREDFQPGENRIGVDADQVLRDIETDGHAMFGAKIIITIKTS